MAAAAGSSGSWLGVRPIDCKPLVSSAETEDESYFHGSPSASKPRRDALHYSRLRKGTQLRTKCIDWRGSALSQRQRWSQGRSLSRGTGLRVNWAESERESIQPNSRLRAGRGHGRRNFTQQPQKESCPGATLPFTDRLSSFL